MEPPRCAIVCLDKEWLVILYIAAVGLSIAQITTSYTAASNIAVEANPFLQYVFRIFPQPVGLLYFAFFETVIVLSCIVLFWHMYPKNISYRHATAISLAIAVLPAITGIHNLMLLLAA